MPTIGDIEQLARHLRQQAEAETGRMLENASKAAEREFEAARAKAREREAEAEARSKARSAESRRAAIGAINLRCKRRLLAAREQAINEVIAAALEELSHVRDRRERLRALAGLLREAAAALGSGRLRVRLGSADRELVEASSPAAFAEVTIDPEPLPDPGGVLASDASGRVQFDNTFAARAQRRRERLRDLAARSLGLSQPEEGV